MCVLRCYVSQTFVHPSLSSLVVVVVAVVVAVVVVVVVVVVVAVVVMVGAAVGAEVNAVASAPSTTFNSYSYGFRTTPLRIYSGCFGCNSLVCSRHSSGTPSSFSRSSTVCARFISG